VADQPLPSAPPRDPSCLFCRVVAGELPSDVVRAGERTLAFRDIDPKAPTHVLVVTRDHYPDLASVVPADPALAADLVADAVRTAEEQGLASGGYRLVVNTGADGGQTVPHVHVHVLGGRHLSWPPG
jgi:histidine triad (HIT) family protein